MLEGGREFFFFGIQFQDLGFIGFRLAAAARVRRRTPRFKKHAKEGPAKKTKGLGFGASGGLGFNIGGA